MPESDLPLLLDAAAEAGRIALGYWRNAPAAWEKEAGPVSEADIAVNAMLAERLRAARPGYGWLSEESADSEERLGRDRVFIVDPIDGTRAFLEGASGFAHALAVVEAGEVVAAVVALPALGLTFAAEAGGRATLNGTALEPLVEGGEASVLTSAAALAEEHWPGGRPEFHRSYRPSLAHRLCLVAEGRFDGTLVLRDTYEWDTAAGSLIAARAGASVTDRRGRPLRFNAARPMSAGVVAAAPGLHGRLMAGLGVAG